MSGNKRQREVVDLSISDDESCSSTDTRDIKKICPPARFPCPKAGVPPARVPSVPLRPGFVHYPPLSSSESNSDALCVAIRHWKQREILVQPNKDYWDLQDQITSEMRMVLVAWLSDVSEEFKLEQETFFLSINLLDRFLSETKTKVSRQNLQLVGIAAIWCASKFEEVYPPSAAQLLEMADSEYRLGELLAMERSMLTVLGFDVSAPTSLKFLGYYMHMMGVESPFVRLTAEHLLKVSTLSAHGCTKRFRLPKLGDMPASQDDPPRYWIRPEDATDPDSPADGGILSPSIPSPCPSLDSTRSSASHLGPNICRTPEQGHECVSPASRAAAAAAPASFSFQGVTHASFACLAAALPSHLAAAAFLTSFAMHFKAPSSLAGLIAASAECGTGDLLTLCQAMRNLHTVLSSEPSPCSIIERFRIQRTELLKAQIQSRQQMQAHQHHHQHHQHQIQPSVESPLSTVTQPQPQPMSRPPQHPMAASAPPLPAAAPVQAKALSRPLPPYAAPAVAPRCFR